MFPALLAVAFITMPLLGAQRPNVIIIFTDDQGSVDMNIYGSTDLTTPNMDQLARQPKGPDSRVQRMTENLLKRFTG